MTRMLALEPYHGGSHAAVLDGLVARLAPAWEVDVLTLPARKWKWRMRGAAITMAEQARALHAQGARWDVVFASTFLNLAEFVALAGDAVAGVPRVVYFHENQLLYPNRHTAEWDFQFPLTNITSALAADACWFNTRWNLDGFLREIPPFLREFPDHVPDGVAERIAPKCRVHPPPFDPTAFDSALPGGVASAPRGPRARIAWPHRWEHDKDPEAFFAAVGTLAAEGLDFEVVIAGQSFRETEGAMREAAEALGDRLVHCDEPATRDEYARLLAGCDIAVSTARNEFFGIAMIEACYAGCVPLVPERLAYPELYPEAFRYGSEDSLVARLRALVLERPAPGAARVLAEAYTFEALAPEWQDALEAVAKGTTPR